MPRPLAFTGIKIPAKNTLHQMRKQTKKCINDALQKFMFYTQLLSGVNDSFMSSLSRYGLILLTEIAKIPCHFSRFLPWFQRHLYHGLRADQHYSFREHLLWGHYLRWCRGQEVTSSTHCSASVERRPQCVSDSGRPVNLIQSAQSLLA